MTIPNPASSTSNHQEHELDSPPDGRPAKRTKVAAAPAVSNAHNEDRGTLVRRHPLGIRPSGNALTSRVNQKDASGFFARLPDDLIALLLEILKAYDLLRLGGTCRALHAFTRNEELWRALFVE